MGFHHPQRAARYQEMGESVKRVLLAGILAVLAGSIGVGAGLLQRAETTPVPSPVSEAVAAGVMLDVHVAGWVVDSGVVSVEEGSIVADAIEAAGGMRPGAMAESINLAAEVHSGDQIVVPGPSGEAGPDQPGDQAGVISLNSADAAELEELPGVGPVLAERIVSFREEKGRFETVDDLLEVPGIGEAKLASIRDLVRP
jgi:competence protein ComEA